MVRRVALEDPAWRLDRIAPLLEKLHLDAASLESFSSIYQVLRTVQRDGSTPARSSGISKVAAFDLTRNYREAYGIHASSAILFNHESPRRGFEFVTRKITSGIARILARQSNVLALENLEAKRD
jgi:GDPmannose 4,6-dehydratase